MTLKNDTLILSQALHGYDNGHTLLASSIEINTETRRTLLVMSDMSGPSMQNGFEEYITGYPLKEINAFAIAKTWYAPEMKRPGCVWTHTLLIQFADLARIVDFQLIKDLFRKPLNIEDTIFYESNVEIEVWRNGGFGMAIVPDHGFLTKLLHFLYESPNQSINIQSSHPKNFEDLVLSIWNQLWPKLRRNFSFCTGAITPRQYIKEYLDLQIVPFFLKNDNANKNDKIKLLNETDSEFGYQDEEWIKLLVEDLLYPSTLRFFCRKFGGDLSANRSSVKPLVQCYLFLKKRSDISVSDIVDMLATNFPRKTEATALKTALLLNKTDISWLNIPDFKEREFLFELATTQFFYAFDYDKLRFEERFKNFYQKNRLEVYELMSNLITSDINSFGEKLLKQAALSTEEDDLVFLNDNRKNLLLVFESLNPKFSYKKDFWLKHYNAHREIISILIKSQKNTKVDWQKVINILIEINSNIDLDYLQSNNIEVSIYILNWVNQYKQELGYNYYIFLRNRPKEVIYWLQSNPDSDLNTLNLITSILDPNSYDVINTDPKLWLNLLEKNSINTLDKLSLRLKSFVLALAFNNSIKKTFDLFKSSFEDVYEAISRDKLEYNSWRHIEVHTQPLNFWNDWDKCKKLMKAITKKFFEEKIPFAKMLELSNKADILKRLESEYKKVKSNF